MIFYKLDSPNQVMAEIIAKKIADKLNSGQKVFWLVTGGSGIGLGAEISKLLNNLPLENLSVTLTDERFVPVGAKDSNWYQLQQAGFNLPNAKLIPILAGGDLTRTAQSFAQNLEKCFSESDFSIAIFGIGPDGHVAGILPGSPAVTSAALAAGYKDEEVTVASPEGVLRGVGRITITPKAFPRLDEAIASVFGVSKKQALDKLEEDLSLQQQPAQALKQVSNLTIYNDYKGETL